MYVIDTCILIEWLVAGQLLEQVQPYLEETDKILIPTIVQLELYKWVLRESDENTADQVIAFTLSCHVIDLTTEIALKAAELHQRHKLATADAVVYASALLHQAELISCDAHFKQLPHVVYLSKNQLS